MHTILRRLGAPKRWRAAEAVLRALGLALLTLCAAVTVWLYRSVHTLPPHEANLRELLAALVAVLGWCMGWLLLLVGQGLFTLVPRPGGFTTLSLPPKGDSDDRPDVADDRGGARPDHLRLRDRAQEGLRKAA